MVRYFTELDVADFVNTTIVLDIDGTFIPERSERLSESASAVVRALAEKNDLYLCSNSGLKDRTVRLAETLGVNYIESHYRKPCIDLRSLTGAEGPLIVIGDKWLTDGRLAKKNRARFIKVGHLFDAHTPWMAALSYRLDAMVYWFVRLLGLHNEEEDPKVLSR